jgi:methylated-DNA-[protein]-cysteine S-methyltransferase
MEARKSQTESKRREKAVPGTTCYAVIDSPLGRLLLGGDGEALTLINFLSGRGAMPPKPEWSAAIAPFQEPIRQLGAYFAGELREFDLPLAPAGTPFQHKVWQELRRIPFGETRSYGELARRLGMPTAARAVGAANGRNPLPIVVPCHRVIGSDGSLTGFYAGVGVKQALLEHERHYSPAREGQLSLV